MSVDLIFWHVITRKFTNYSDLKYIISWRIFSNKISVQRLASRRSFCVKYPILTVKWSQNLVPSPLEQVIIVHVGKHVQKPVSAWMWKICRCLRVCYCSHLLKKFLNQTVRCLFQLNFFVFRITSAKEKPVPKDHVFKRFWLLFGFVFLLLFNPFSSKVAAKRHTHLSKPLTFSCSFI